MKKSACIRSMSSSSLTLSETVNIMYSPLAGVVHQAMTEDKQYHYIFANFLAPCEFGYTEHKLYEEVVGKCSAVIHN